MKKSGLKKVFKIIGFLLFIGVIVLIALFLHLIKPKTDEQIITKFRGEAFRPFIHYIDYKNYKVRVIKMQEILDTILPTLVFVHGSPGSSLDFKKYLVDADLNARANIITYDRIGYDFYNAGEVLNSIDEEVLVLHQILQDLEEENIILVGYSYGGTIVMASPKKVKNKIVLAAAVQGELEPMFWALNLYKWNFTRPLIPKTMQAAAREKLKHITELPTYENRWNLSQANVISIHGTSDRIVPFQNSLFLATKIDKEKFRLIPIDKGNHALIWTNFDFIKNEILKTL